MSNDYYQILGVNNTASEDEIKKAYRKLAMKHHPDRGGNAAEFQKVQEAYSVLSDPQKRQEYDNPQPQGFNQHFYSSSGSFEDIIRQFNMGGFGGLGDIFGSQFRQPRRNRTINLQTAITLEEAFYGKELVANLTLPSGREQIVNIKIPAGIHDGNTLRIQGVGDQPNVNLPPGDIHLSVTVIPHSQFQRSGDDLITDIEISAFDAILGTNIHVETIDKKMLNVTINPGTQPGSIFKLQGYGMPNVNDNRFRGALLLNIKITIPNNLTERQKDLIRQAKA